MTGKYEFTLQPFIVDAFVECTAQDMVVGSSLADRLFQQEGAVESVETQLIAVADHDIASHVVDAGTLDQHVLSMLG